MTLKALVCVLLVMGLAACKSERVQGPKNNVQKVLSDFVFSQAGGILGRVQNRFVVDRNGFHQRALMPFTKHTLSKRSERFGPRRFARSIYALLD